MAQPTETEAPPENQSTPVTAERSDVQSSEPEIRRARRPFPKALLAIVILIAAAGALGLWMYFSQYESTDDAQIDAHIDSLSSRVTGYITNVNVDDNQYVEAGTVLAQIDPKDYQVAVDRARADLAAAEASATAAEQNVPITRVNTAGQIDTATADIESAQAGIQAAQRQADAAKAALAEAQANDAKAQSDLERYKQLVDKQEISLQQFDQAVAAAKASSATVQAAAASASAAQEQVRQARSRLVSMQAALRTANSAPQQVAVSRAQSSSADASVAQKRAALEAAMLNLQYCTIVAPVAGVVNRSVEVGMNVQPGQQLMAVVPLDDVWVTADYKETQLKYMRPGQPAEISVDAYGRKYRGHVESIAGASGARFSLLPPENATGNYVKVVQRVPVKIVLDPGQNKDHLLRPGMSVTPTVKVK
jgi:membrane fusion protein (multidrug efflux system)